MNDPTKSHMNEYKRIPIYMNETLGYEIFFPWPTDQDDPIISCFFYANGCEGKIDRRSTIRYFFNFFRTLAS